jgi:hypothetical protein
MKISNWTLFLLPLGLSLLVLWICYPGFMSYDSIRMLEEARSSVRGGIFPATPVYILRLFDITGNGQTFMIQAQNFILLFSFMMIFRISRASLFASTICLLTLIAMPTVIGCMLVLWKDVTLTSFIMLSIAMIFLASQQRKNNKYYKAIKWSSLLLIIIGTLVRFNAITSTIIIAIYWVNVFYKKQECKKRIYLIVAIGFSIIGTNTLINNYRFPNFRKLDQNPIIYSIMSYDLIGISGWSRVSLVPINSAESDLLPKASMADIDRIYSSLGALHINNNNIALGNIVSIYPKKYNNEDILNTWFAALTEHPMAYVSYRWDLFSEIIGAKSHETFEPTHFSRIDENPFGIKFSDRYITFLTLKYIRSASNVFWGKPWFIFLLSSISIFLILKNNKMPSCVKELSYYSYFSGVLYIIPFFIISGTGEVRYCFPAIILSSVSIFSLTLSKKLTNIRELNNVGV